MGMRPVPLCLEGPMGAGCRLASGGVPGGGHELVALPMCRARRLCWWQGARSGHGGDRMDQDLSCE